MQLNMRLRKRRAALALALLFCLVPAAAGAQEPVAPDAVPALVPLSSVAAITAGGLDTCALTTADGVKCWGQNLYGQVGDGTTTDRLTPVDVSGLTSGVQAVAVGSLHTCALTTAGGVKCWGLNSNGRLGDGTNIDRWAPVDVSGLTSGARAITMGDLHTCALTTVGGVKCWGVNYYGQLGDGTTTDRLTPVDVSNLTSGVKAIAAGLDHTCALTTAGGVKCWGYNNLGQLGDGTTTDSSTPVDVSGLTSGVQAVGAGTFYTCALMTVGGVNCWGQNYYGQLGNGTTTDSLTFGSVSGLTSGVQAIALSQNHTCALTTAGGIKCWGANGGGQLGDGTTTSRLTPVDVFGLTSGVQAVAMGDDHSCALTIAGDVKCWGYNLYGQLGDGTTIQRFLSGDVLVPRTCFKLTATRTGSGAAPAIDQAASLGCPLGNYLPGAWLQLRAVPATGQRVQAWGAPAQGEAGATLASLTMPSADTTVNVAYAPCLALTLSHTGSGGNLQAAPSSSRGCAANAYAAGEAITLVAVPAANQRVKQWSGTTAAPATGSQVNTLVMPAAAKAVSVAYEVCFALSATVVGSGQITQVTPAASNGCVAASSYAAGESVQLVAQAAPGYSFMGWSGGVTSTANPLAVTVNGPLALKATFAPTGAPSVKLFLPTITR